jgi:hypothetical protein
MAPLKKEPILRYSLAHLQEEGQKVSPVGFAKLPLPSTLTFLEQQVSIKGSNYKLYVGQINIEGTRIPLYAHIAHPGHVEFRYGIENIATQKDRLKFKLIQPFTHFYTGHKRVKLAALETLIAYLFVADGKWPGLIDGGRYNVSRCVQFGMRHACESGRPRHWPEW